MDKLRAILAGNFWEGTVGTGAGLAFLGLWLIYPPAACIALGIGLILFGFWGAKAWASWASRSSDK